jgi:hypothetical protein
MVELKFVNKYTFLLILNVCLPRSRFDLLGVFPQSDIYISASPKIPLRSLGYSLMANLKKEKD